MKIEIEEVLQIIRDKQTKLNDKIGDLAYKVACYPINDNPQNRAEYEAELSTFRELTAAFLALGEVYASLSARELHEAEQEALRCRGCQEATEDAEK